MEFRKLISVGVLCLILGGCVCNPVVIEKAVVQPWPEPPIISRPIIQLTSNDSDSNMIRNMNITVLQLMEYSKMLENSLNAYRHTEATK